MKIFAVTADVELSQKPEWLDGFRAQYDEPFALHVTLKQPSIVDEDQIARLQSDLAQFFEQRNHNIQAVPVVFDRMNVSLRSRDDICIMIDATEANMLDRLHQEIVQAIGPGFTYCQEEYRSYEERFHPHITIARDLMEKNYGEAVKAWTPDFTCEGIVKTCTLVVVPELTAGEANKAENRTVYRI